MLAKPLACVGCPLFGDGQGFVPDSIPDGAEVVILAQNPGADEEKGQRVIGYDGKRPIYEPCEPQPLIGKTGYDVRNRFVPLLGTNAVGYANVLKCRWTVDGKRTNNLPVGETLTKATEWCTRVHLKLPAVKLIIAMGALAWECTQGKGLTITDWRGFIGPRRVETHDSVRDRR